MNYVDQSNTRLKETGSRLFCGLAICLMTLGCTKIESSKEAEATELDLNEDHISAGSTDSDLMQSIDPPPIKTEKSVIVSQEDLSVAGNAACNYVVRYRDHIDQTVTWAGESCSEITARFVSFRKLQNLNVKQEISPEVLGHLQKLPAQSVFYVEGKFSASIFPINNFDRIYEVSIAD